MLLPVQRKHSHAIAKYFNRWRYDALIATVRANLMVTEVSGWGVYCYDFLLLPITSYYS